MKNDKNEAEISKKNYRNSFIGLEPSPPSEIRKSIGVSIAKKPGVTKLKTNVSKRGNSSDKTPSSAKTYSTDTKLTLSNFPLRKSSKTQTKTNNSSKALPDASQTLKPTTQSQNTVKTYSLFSIL